MAELRELCVGLGFERVSTYVQTGNVVFEADGDAAELATRFESRLRDRGLKNTDVTLRTRAELADIVASFPAAALADPERRRLVTFFRSPIPPEFATLLGEAEGTISVRERELVTVSRLDQPMAKDPREPIVRKMKVPGTARYWNVAAAVLEMMDAPA
jgi:uncharacterized protein (DUF1697 family)